MSNEQLKIEYLPWNNENGKNSLRKDQLKENFNDKFFDDLNKWNVKIKKQGNLYIFEQKDVNSSRISDNNNYIKKFYVKENIFKDYLKEEQKKEEISLESDVLLNEFFSIIKTKQELYWLIRNVEQNHESFKMDIDNLLNWLENNKTRPKAPRIGDNKHSKHRFEQVIKDDISSLQSIKRELNRYTYTTNVDYFKNYVDEIKNHKEQLEKIRQIVVTWWNIAEIPAMLDSMKDVKKEDLFQTIAANYNVEYNTIMKNVTLNKLWNKDMEWFQEYLEWVRSWEIQHPDQDKFYMKYKKDFEEIQSIDPTLYGNITTKKERRNNSINNTNITNNSNILNNRNWWWVEKWGNLFSDALVKLWIIDENDKTKQAARAKFGKVGLLALWAFAIYKIFTTKWVARRGRIWWTVWWLFAVNNTDKIKSWFKDAFGKSDCTPEEIANQTNISPDIAQEYITPQAATLRCIGGISINTLTSLGIVEEKWGKMRINYDKYTNYMNNPAMNTTMTPSEKQINMSAMLELKNDPTWSMLDNSLKYMWITDIKWLNTLAGNDPEKTLLDTPNVSSYFERLSSPINADLAKEWFKPANANAWYEMTNEYIGTKPSNEKILERISKWYLQLNEEKNYKLENIMKNPNIESLKNKTIKWLKNSSGNLIKFETYGEMFNTIQLTQFIKDNFKDKMAKTEEPFHISELWNIEFDDTKWYEPWKNETNVVNANFYKNTLGSITPTLLQYKEDYIKYLNERRNIEWKVSS